VALLGGLLAGALSMAGGARLERTEFTFNNGTEVTTLDPATVSGVPEGRIIRALFEGLCVKHPSTIEAIPGAADRWSLSEDRTVYTFHIREGARWSNGDPLTAHDFVFSWERMLNPLTAAEYAYQLWYVTGAREYTHLVDDLAYQGEWDQNLWVEERDGGRLRIGCSGYLLTDGDRERQVVVTVREGDEFAGGATIATLGGTPLRLSLGGRVVAVNASLPAAASTLARDAYGEGWLIELEASPGALAGALEHGDLIPGADFRAERVFPERVGIRALDTQTLEVRLVSPTPYFLQLVAFYPLFPVNRRNLEEARARWPGSWELRWMRPENIVTNGPYTVEFRRVNDRIRMVKNPDYWDAENVAIETMDALAIDHLGTSINLYLTGEVDWIDRPITSIIPRLLPREDFNPAPYLGSYFYRVNVERPPFDDPRVRKALALTIERLAICLKITKAGEEPAWAFTPPGLPGYRKVEMASHAARGMAAGPQACDAGFARDVDRARELLAEAGFGPGGATLPTIEIHYNTDETHKDVAEVIADGWKKRLGLNVKLLNQEWKVYLDTQKTRTFDVSRSAWIGDYADPNTFLDMFVTGGENNRTGWGNLRYDELIAAAALEPDPARRMELFVEAEAILMDELPILPIYFYVTRNLVNPRLGGFHENVIDDHFPKHWYWMDDEELAAKRAAQPAEWREVPARGPSEGRYSPVQQRERAE
jgi:oligopeptide transport system substrate-binding protein